MKNGDKPAYPTEWAVYTKESIEPESGLTKREIMAMAAMQGFITALHQSSNSAKSLYEVATESGKTTWDLIAEKSVDHADALLAELEKVYDSKKGKV